MILQKFRLHFYIKTGIMDKYAIGIILFVPSFIQDLVLKDPSRIKF